jgi:hypothetical protein
MDRFSPRDFLCNRNADLEFFYHRFYHPETRFLVPRRNEWILIPETEF